MDVDNWYELADLNSYLDEDTVLKALDDVDLEAERFGDDRRIFRLGGFFVYDENNVQRLIPLDFNKLDGLCIAGTAIPIYPDDTDDEKDENEPPNTVVEFNVRLSAIQKVEYTFLDVSMAGCDGIYVLTSFGWYLLQRPAQFYLDTYKETYHQFRLALAILRRAYEDPSEKLSEFITKFRRFAAWMDRKYTNALEYGYPELRPSDLQQSNASIAHNINFFIHDLKAQLEGGELDSYQRGSIVDVYDRLMQSRIVHKVLQGYLATIRRREDIQAAPLPPPLTVPEPLTIADDETSDEDMDEEENDGRKAKPSRRTCVTPIIERVARRVFIHPLNLIGTPLPDVTWKQSRSRGTPVAGNGVKMKRGQCILVPVGIDEVLQYEDRTFNHEKSRSENSAANEYWFAQVLATTEDGERLHVRWFDHSSKTVLLKELERPMELFLTQRCGYIQRSHVKRTVDVQWIGPGQNPVDKEEHYYVRFIREMDGSYTWAKQSNVQLDRTEKREMADNCEVCKRAKADGIWFQDRTLKINGLDLHKGDFIVTQPTDSSPWFDGSRNNRTMTPGQIFQLVGLTRAKEGDRVTPVALLLQPLERVDTLSARGLVSPGHAICPGRPKRDERRVCLMDTWNCRIELADIKRHPLRKCFVRHPDAFESIEDMNEWLGKSPIHFIVDLRAQPSLDDSLEDPLNLRPAASVETLTSDVFRELARPCGRCQNEMSDTRVTKLRMLDLFCGAGGLSEGLVASGVCVPEFALDHDGAALETYRREFDPIDVLSRANMYIFRRNFSGAKTIHQDANVALSKSLIAALKGHNRAPTSEDLDEPLPLPGRRDVDLICAGPPCQSFSMANHFKRDDDPRTAMIAAVMSAIDHYRPKYFLIENVPNAFTTWIAGPTAREGSTHSDSTGITEDPSSYVEQGVYRFIVRSALDLGYAFRVGILQAAEYGAPQLRRRAFIIGARDGYTLPDFPLATHCVPRPNTGLRQPNGSYVDPIRDRSGNAVHRPITIWDAIGDLAPFEWVNPHVIIRQTDTSREEEQRRRTRLKIPPYNAVHEDRTAVGPGANGAIPYRDRSPFTTYQHLARGGLETVTAHYTSSFRSPIFVERVVSIHPNAYADHRTLPEALRKGDFMSNVFGSGGTNGYYKGGFGRYAKEQQFLTILTSLRPAKRNGFCIHPEQKRMLTMRELARAQGFPDRFEFFGTVDQVNRQIGNAVTIQLAEGIGREIRKAMIKDKQF